MIHPLKIVIFHSHVSLPEGKYHFSLVIPMEFGGSEQHFLAGQHLLPFLARNPGHEFEVGALGEF